MKNTIPFFMLIIGLIASCKSEKEKLTASIASKEQELLADSVSSIDRNKAKEMISLYKQYAEKFSADTMSYEYIFKAADIANGIGEYREAIELYKQVAEKNNFRKQAVAFFLQGFIYENQLNDYFKARVIYEDFLKKYPEHPLADDVRYSLQNLGKTPEQLIKEFESKNAGQDSLALKN